MQINKQLIQLAVLRETENSNNECVLSEILIVNYRDYKISEEKI